MWLARQVHACQTDMTVNFGISYSSVAITCCFVNVAQDVCKGETKAFQQADDVLDTYGFRPRAVKEDERNRLIKVFLTVRLRVEPGESVCALTSLSV